ncbi:DUF3093 domain-containing protein [Brachybacterium sp. AOP25-B2-12]|uniref:DUF3093 domain-containing protein n=1 Tax=Brachybacterium sp. AOP25-B2-12 TaxID=3457710 RepID=UPI004033C706
MSHDAAGAQPSTDDQAPATGPVHGDAPPATADTVLFRERLLPSVGVWIVGALTGGLFGLILVPISVEAGFVVSILMAIGVCVIFAATSSVLEVREGLVRAGSARIEPELLGIPAVLEGEAWTEVMGTGFEPLAFHVTRGWIRRGVRVPVLDREDPTTAWVLSSRHPDQLARALRAAA